MADSQAVNGENILRNSFKALYFCKKYFNTPFEVVGENPKGAGVDIVANKRQGRRNLFKTPE